MNKLVKLAIFLGVSGAAGTSFAVATSIILNPPWKFIPGSVTQGDTFKAVKKGTETEQTIKVCGISAPELNKPFGAESKEYLEELLENNEGKLIIKFKKEKLDDKILEAQAYVLEENGVYISVGSRILGAGMAERKEKVNCFVDSREDENLADSSRFAKTFNLGMYEVKTEKMTREEIKQQVSKEFDERKKQAEQEGVTVHESTVEMPWGTYQRLKRDLEIAIEQRDAAQRACKETKGCALPRIPR